MKKTITAVVVTFNRFNYLTRVVACLRSQTISLDNIIVVNNGSTDQTYKWLQEQDDLKVINQENVGGAGGFYRGIQEAYSLGYDLIWCMDDDVYPRPDTLAQLLNVDKENIGILCPKRIQNGKVFVSEYKRLNLSNPLKPLHLAPLEKSEVMDNKVIDIVGMVFEGPLIKREVVTKIGLPNKDLFILYDDTDYSYRASLAGYKVVYVPTSIIDKEFFAVNMTRKEELRAKRWKLWYHIRNTFYFCHHYGKNSLYCHFGEYGLLVHMSFAIIFNLICCTHKYDNRDLIQLFKMCKRGHKEILGKM